MKFRSLASSSHGNAYIVSDGETRILLECGISYRKIQRLSGFTAASFDGCLVSHEHKDHSLCVREIVKNGVPVFMSQGTAQALWREERLREAEISALEQAEAGARFKIGTMDVVPFATFHDAAEPLGFLVRSRADGDKLVFATDTVNLPYRFPGVSILALEANYDPEILDLAGKMPEKVRRRITNSHMEIGRLCGILRNMDLRQCREVYLLHLSDANSNEGSFARRAAANVPPWVRVTVCGRGG